MIPEFIRRLDSLAENAESDFEIDSNLPFIAAYFFAEFQVKEGFPVLLRFLSLPEDVVDNLFGDMVTEHLSYLFARIMPSLSDLDTIIADQRIDPFIRSSAAGCIQELGADGLLSRPEAIALLLGHLRRVTESDDDPTLAEMLVTYLADCGADPDNEIISEADRLYDVFESIITPEEMTHCAQNPDEEWEQTLKIRREGRLATTTEAVAYWQRQWQPRAESPWITRLAEITEEIDPFHDFSMDDDPRDAPIESAPIYREQNRIGRNDPCFCGSGKKFKKCCGSSK
jgi:hypothetical protein